MLMLLIQHEPTGRLCSPELLTMDQPPSQILPTAVAKGKRMLCFIHTWIRKSHHVPKRQKARKADGHHNQKWKLSLIFRECEMYQP